MLFLSGILHSHEKRNQYTSYLDTLRVLLQGEARDALSTPSMPREFNQNHLRIHSHWAMLPSLLLPKNRSYFKKILLLPENKLFYMHIFEIIGRETGEKKRKEKK